MVIYYFTGTGNSLYIAKRIAEKTGGSIQPISRFSDRETVIIDNDGAGIVFPVYYGGLPVMVRRFAQKLLSSGEEYVFAVCNYGGAAAKSLRLLKDILAYREIKLNAGFGLHMPQNAFKKPWEKVNRVYAHAEKRIEKIAKMINMRTFGMHYTNYPLEAAMRLMDSKIKRMCRDDFLKRTRASNNLTTDELINLIDINYSTDKNCNGCGTCAKVCPAENIVMINKKPEWLHRCENCLACYNWCPEKAIHGTVAKEGHFYRHEKIKVKDIIIT